jgi:hypothetical protein
VSLAWHAATVLALTFGCVAAPALELTAGSGAAQSCPPAGTSLSGNASAIAYLEPAPLSTINDYGGNQYDPAPGTNRGVAIGFGELTGGIAGYCVGAIYRAEYWAQGSRDALDVLVSNHQGHAFESGRTYALALHEESFKAEGARLRRVFEVALPGQWAVKIGAGGSLLKGSQGQDESLAGSVTATSSTYAVGTATYLQTATNLNLKNFNPFVAAGSASGYGFSTDVELIAASSGGASLDVVVMDAIGRIYWHDVPRSERVLANSAIRYNADLNREALINGIDARVNFTQALPAIYHVAYTQPVVEHLDLSASDDAINGLHFPAIGMRYGGSNSNDFGELTYDIRTKAVGIGGHIAYVHLLLTSNKLRLSDATVLGLSLQVQHSW